MEIEKKYLLRSLPENLDSYPHSTISQGYLSTDPVLRIRQYGEKYILTIKSSGLMERIEVEKPLSKEEYEEMSIMVKGNLISKERYLLPLADYPELKVELDIFGGIFEGLIVAEVEFPDIEKARSFVAPDYFSREVTDDPRYQNSSLSSMDSSEIEELLRISI